MLAVQGNGRERRERRLAGDWPAPRQLSESSSSFVDENFDPAVGDVVKYFNEFMKTLTNPQGTE
jgi:hypothetical protein